MRQLPAGTSQRVELADTPFVACASPTSDSHEQRRCARFNAVHDPQMRIVITVLSSRAKNRVSSDDVIPSAGASRSGLLCPCHDVLAAVSRPLLPTLFHQYPPPRALRTHSVSVSLWHLCVVIVYCLLRAWSHHRVQAAIRRSSHHGLSIDTDASPLHGHLRPHDTLHHGSRAEIASGT